MNEPATQAIQAPEAREGLDEPARARAAAWSGAITLTPFLSLFVGTGGTTSLHAHPVHKVVLGADGVSVRGARHAGPGPVAIPAAAPHRIGAGTRRIAMLYLDPRRFDWADAERLAARFRRFDPAADPTGELLDALADRPLRRALDPRAERAVAALRGPDRLGAIAERLRLSESRLSHLVASELGAPPPSWRVWLRLRTAIDAVAEGGSVTEAAARTGFADAAHFARTCRTTLGIPPSALKHCQLHLDLGPHDCGAV